MSDYRTGVIRRIGDRNHRSNPILINRMPYGKHKIRFTEIPLDYLQWLLTTKLDDDMAYTVRHHLEIGD